MECEYCKKSFKNKGTLKTHQNTTKYCLELRNQHNDKWKCSYCEKNLTSKQSLESHYEKCVNKNIFNQLKIEIEKLKNENEIIKNLKDIETKKLENQITKLETQNKSLQDQIKELASLAIEKPNSITHQTNNNQTNNNQNNSIKNIDNRTINMLPLNINTESISKALQDKFEEKHLMKGQKGVAEFMLENVLIIDDNNEKKYLMKCSDSSRKVFISLDEKGNIIKDVNADNLTKMISDPVKEQCHKIYKQIQDRYFQVYENVGNELEVDTPDKENLDLESQRLEHATNKVVEISRLKNNNVEFVKNLIPALSN